MQQKDTAQDVMTAVVGVMFIITTLATLLYFTISYGIEQEKRSDALFKAAAQSVVLKVAKEEYAYAKEDDFPVLHPGSLK